MIKFLGYKILVLFLVFVWVFSGFPQIWQNPSFPPEIQNTQATHGSRAHMLLFWDGGAAPTGWSIVTTYDGKFPRGETVANVGVTGGNTTHSLTISGSVTLGAPDNLRQAED